MTETHATRQGTTWYGAYLGHLRYIGGLVGKRDDTLDLGALAELRASARGGAFVIRALRHIVPYLREDEPYHDHKTRVGLIVGQLFAAHRPEHSGPVTDAERIDGRRSVGRLLGTADGVQGIAGQSDESHSAPTALERHLQTVVASDFQQLGTRLRGTFARLKAAGVTPVADDYAALLEDLTYWNGTEKRVQYRWVRDFYTTRYVTRSGGRDENA